MVLDMVAPRSPQYRMADQLAGGNLEQILADIYQETGSWETTARRLYVEYRIDVTTNTLRGWATALGIGAAA